MPDPRPPRFSPSEADALIERLKRALDEYVAAHGLRPRSPVDNYCRHIGLGVETGGTAGMEYRQGDALLLAEAIEDTSMPFDLKRYWKGLP